MRWSDFNYQCDRLRWSGILFSYFLRTREGYKSAVTHSRGGCWQGRPPPSEPGRACHWEETTREHATTKFGLFNDWIGHNHFHLIGKSLHLIIFQLHLTLIVLNKETMQLVRHILWPPPPLLPAHAVKEVVIEETNGFLRKIKRPQTHLNCFPFWILNSMVADFSVLWIRIRYMTFLKWKISDPYHYW